MTQKDFFHDLIGKIESAEIPYMVTGSFASSFHGEPRASNDSDIIIAPTLQQLEVFIQSLGSDYYVDPNTARDAFYRKTMFNIIDIRRGWKADLIIRKNRAFSREEFRRRISGRIGDIPAMIVSPEDVILAKLEWAKTGQSELQFRDALGVAAIQWQELDIDYLMKWGKELEIDQILTALLEQAKQLQSSE
ncbi:MAG: hypothetical protein V1789_09695 [PVC group bacterium]